MECDTQQERGLLLSLALEGLKGSGPSSVLGIVYLLLVTFSKCPAGDRAANAVLGRGSLEIAMNTPEVIM